MQSHLIISAQTLIESPSVRQAETLQNKFHEVWNSSKFLEELDTLLSNRADENDWVILDKLELTLEGLSTNMSESHLKSLILEKVDKSISKVIQTNAQVEALSENPKAQERGKASSVSKEKLLNKLTKTWEQVVSRQLQGSSFTTSYASLLELFLETQRQFKKEERSFKEWINTFVNNYKIPFAENLPIQTLALFVKEVLFIFKGPLDQVEKLSLKAVQRKQEESKRILKFVKGQLYLALIEKEKPKHVEEVFETTIKVLTKIIEEGVDVEKVISEHELALEPELQNEEIKRTEHKKPESTDNSVFVDNAGMAIVFPYLSTVFKNLGYSDEAEIQDPSRAIHFLSFLETGEEFFAPHRTTIYKVICGQTQEFWIDPDIVLSDFEKGEANALLESVIEHWGALKNSSPDGLREAFLRRKGKLSMKDFDFNLKVESLAQDILLTRIPWGFGTIKLPWMTNFLHVDW
jgi:hypothetical protein